MAKKKKPVKPAAPAPVQKPAEPSPEPAAGKRVKDFESAVAGQLEKEPPRNWGGARESAGRPAKETLPIAAGQPFNAGDLREPIKSLFGMPFEFWADKAKLPELALSDMEAELLTDPAIVILNHFLPGILTDVHIAIISFVLSAVYVLNSKGRIARKNLPKPVAPGAPSPENSASASLRKGTTGAGGFPSVEDVLKNKNQKGTVL